MSYHIFSTICSLGVLVTIVNSDDVAVSNRLSRQICNSYDNSQYGRVLPDSSQSLPVCPVFEREGSSNEWVFNNCGGDDEGGNKRSGRVRGLNKPKSGDGDGGEDYDERIVNGRDGPPFSHPYLVYVRTPLREKGVSGIIYNRYTILVHTYHLGETLAKAGKMDNLRIHIGKHKSQIRENEEEIRFPCNHTTHPKYQVKRENNADWIYPYSALHLYDPITINNYADKARIAKPSQSSSVSKDCLVPGWGRNVEGQSFTSETLQEANATVQECKGKVKPRDNEFCTNPVYCYSDAGSPLVGTDKHRIFATGMVSRYDDMSGFKCKTAKDTIYADLKIQDVHDWVEQSYKDHEAMCRSWVRAEVLNAANVF